MQKVHTSAIVAGEVRRTVFRATGGAASGVGGVCYKPGGTGCTCRGVPAGELVFTTEIPATSFGEVTRTYTAL